MVVETKTLNSIKVRLASDQQAFSKVFENYKDLKEGVAPIMK